MLEDINKEKNEGGVNNMNDIDHSYIKDNNPSINKNDLSRKKFKAKNKNIR